MKKRNISLMALTVLVLLIASCNKVLNTKPTETLDENAVWKNRAVADGFVFDTYNNIIGGYINGNTRDWEASTSNMIVKPWGGLRNWFNQDLIEVTSDFGFFGNYGHLRKANMIIEKAKEYNGKGLSDTDTKELTAQGKMLRAMHYFRQARGVGRIVWIDRVLTPEDTVNNALADFKLTDTPSQSYEYIIKDIEDAITGLPEGSSKSVMNKWAGYAFLSEVCLQAAAYETDNTKKATILKKGIAAVDELETKGGYSLVSNFGDMFNDKNSSANNEIIFGYYKLRAFYDCGGTDMQKLVPNVNNDRMDKSGSSPHFTKVGGLVFEAWGDFYPTQNLADAYLVVDQSTGQAVKWHEASQFKNAVNFENYTTAPAWGSDATLSEMQVGTIQLAGSAKVPGTNISKIMYADRDARFYDTFVYDDSEWFGERVYTRFRGNLNRYVSENNLEHYASLTNLYLRKGIYNNPEGDRVYVSNKTDYHWVIFRLGRAILNKAEAQLWLAGMGDTYTYTDAVATFNKTRTTHGKLPASTASNSADAWNDYITERRAELAYENDIYWSALRWGLHGGDANKGIASSITNPGKAAYLLEEPTFIELSKDASQFFVSTVSFQDIHKRDFREDRRYLLPIQKSKLEANPKLGPQNKGW